MREFDAFALYPQPKEPRRVSAERSGIHNRIIAAYRGVAFYDGARGFGYGGLTYDGRWEPVARYMAREYGLGADSTVLQIGCDKGFLLAEFQKLGIGIRGTEVSQYAIQYAPDAVRAFLQFVPPWALPFHDGEFDLVICAGPVYSLTLENAMQTLREIARVGTGQSFVTLGAFDTQEDYWLFRAWTLLGCTILSREDWIEVLEHVGYAGDYRFNTAESLRLQWA